MYLDFGAPQSKGTTVIALQINVTKLETLVCLDTKTIQSSVLYVFFFFVFVFLISNKNLTPDLRPQFGIHSSNKACHTRTRHKEQDTL